MAFINRWALTAWAKPWVPFRLSREHDGSSGSQVPSHRRFNVGVIVVHGATAAIKDHGNKLIKMSLPMFRGRSRGVSHTRPSHLPRAASTPPFRSRDLAPPLAAPAKHLPALVPRDLLPFHRCVPLRFLCALISAWQWNHAIRVCTILPTNQCSWNDQFLISTDRTRIVFWTFVGSSNSLCFTSTSRFVSCSSFYYTIFFHSSRFNFYTYIIVDNSNDDCIV